MAFLMKIYKMRNIHLLIADAESSVESFEEDYPPIYMNYSKKLDVSEFVDD